MNMYLHSKNPKFTTSKFAKTKKKKQHRNVPYEERMERKIASKRTQQHFESLVLVWCVNCSNNTKQDVLLTNMYWFLCVFISFQCLPFYYLVTLLNCSIFCCFTLLFCLSVFLKWYSSTLRPRRVKKSCFKFNFNCNVIFHSLLKIIIWYKKNYFILL